MMLVLDYEARCALHRALLANRCVRVKAVDHLGPLLFITGKAFEEDSGFDKMGEAFYQELAAGEIERLSTPEGERSLKCAHKLSDHKDALQRVLDQISR